ncbi:MAG: glycosyltransferase family 39 protein [Saprospiraceae bacterium]|nr:glycosyltransferase family 39 protein [Pyrinomonadaceae bacterium]
MKTDPNKQEETEGRDWFWLISGAFVTAIAALLRFYQLGLKPFHHDEGVNGFFLTTLFRSDVYRYDPANYHGPTLYYISLVFAKVFGLETVPVRASVAIFGVLTVVLALFLRRYIGRIGSLFAALFLALSPGMVFISRYFIHEIFFVFLSLAIVLSILFFLEKRKAGVFAIGWMALILLICFLPSTLNLAGMWAGENSTALWSYRIGLFLLEAVLVFFVMRMLILWNEGRPIYILLASASAALMFATKETAFITLGTMLIACVCVWLWTKIYGKTPEPAGADELSGESISWAGFRKVLGGKTDVILIIVAALVVFVYVNVLFFSSFFTYPEGVQKAIDAYTIWMKTGSKDHTQNGFWGYLKWMWRIEAPILLLSALGTLIALLKPRHRVAVFVGFWAFGLAAAYSIIPYKTPWLALSFILPMCIAAGYAINELFASQNVISKIAGGTLAAAATGVLAYQTYDINFVRYDDNDLPYIYAHTRRQYLDMINEIDRYAEKSGKGRDAAVQIVSPDYWPMVWDVKDYPKAVFHGTTADAAGAEMIVAKKKDQDEEVIRKYSADYRFVGMYGLRPGVDLVLLVRKDLADSNTKELYKIREVKGF